MPENRRRGKGPRASKQKGRQRHCLRFKALESLGDPEKLRFDACGSSKRSRLDSFSFPFFPMSRIEYVGFVEKVGVCLVLILVLSLGGA
jgi:hypothetical protein